MSSSAHRSRHIAVIGGGWAGCAAAVTLARHGCRVTLYESARILGGRARRVAISPAEGAPVTVDNGQHILLGAYTTTLSLLKTVGIDPKQALLRLPLQMCYPHDTGMHFVAPRLPAPWHVTVALLRAKGLTRADKLSLARFSTSAKWMKWTLYDDCTVAKLLDRFDQTDRLITLLWEPLCIAALNTPIETASAQLFLHVLRDSLGAKRSASDMLIPRVDLSTLFPDAAADYVTQHQGEVHRGTTVHGVAPVEGDVTRWTLTGKDGATLAQVDGIVIATPPEQAAQLVHGSVDTTFTALLRSFDYQPITTCYLQYTPETSLDRPFYALVADAASRAWGQFVFDRGQISPDATQKGLLAVVISTAGQAIEQGHTSLTEDVTRQLAAVFQRPELANPVWTKVISEKRATFAATPALARPDNATAIARIVLAGDYTASDYPATLETAMRSGKDAAKHLLQIP